MENKELNEKMLEVIKIIDKRKLITANEISEMSGISYITVQKYLNELKNEGIVIEALEDKSQGKIKRYSLNYKYLHSKED